MWRQRERLGATAASGAVALSAAWALWPLDLQTVQPRSLPSAAASDAAPPAEPGFDRGPFAAAIWNPAPIIATVPAPTPAPAPIAPAPKLQLVGIFHGSAASGGAVLRAALYDPDADRLHLAAMGDIVAGITVTAVDSSGVSLAGAGRTSRLTLRDLGHARGTR